MGRVYWTVWRGSTQSRTPGPWSPLSAALAVWGPSWPSRGSSMLWGATMEPACSSHYRYIHKQNYGTNTHTGLMAKFPAIFNHWCTALLHLYAQSCQSCPILFQRYNPHTDEWALVASLPIPRSGFGATVMDNALYLCGGCNNFSKVVNIIACAGLTEFHTVLSCFVCR